MILTLDDHAAEVQLESDQFLVDLLQGRILSRSNAAFDLAKKVGGGMRFSPMAGGRRSEQLEQIY
jgi:hypothetical protein